MFGKETDLKKLCAAVVLFLISSLSSAADFSYSEEILSRDLDRLANRQSYLYHEDRWIRGLSLLWLFPLMEEAYDFTVGTGSESEIINRDNPQEDWASAYLFREDGQLSLLYNDRLFRDISSLSFSGSEVDSDSLEIWISWEGVDRLKNILQDFADEKNITLKILDVPGPEAKLVAVTRARGSIPDLVMVKNSSMGQLAAEKAIQPVSYIILPEFNSQGIEAFTIENRLYGVPFYCDTQVLLYNRSLVNPPSEDIWTLKEMELLAGGQPPEVLPLVWNAYSSNWQLPFEFSYGRESLLNGQGSIDVDADGAAEALHYVIGLIDRGLLHPMERDAMDAHFINGKAAIIMTGSYSLPYFESLGVDAGVLPFPVNNQTGEPVRPLLDYKGFVMTRKTASPVLARRFIQYLSSLYVLQSFCPELHKIPPRPGVAGAPEIRSSLLDELVKAGEQGVAIPPEREYDIYKNNMWKLLRFALNRQMTVEETLRRGQILMDNTTKE